MMCTRVHRGCLGLMLAGGWAALAAQPLQHDLFARPSLSAPPSTSATPGGRAADSELVWQPKLSAVMVAGRHSLVMVDGVVVGLGQEVNGYALKQVREGQAVFARGKTRIVLIMDASNE
jgi:hypothetical protein